MRYVFYLAPVVLSVLAIAVLRFGWPWANRFRNPSRFRFGLVLIAAGLVGLWLLPAGLYVAGGRIDTQLKGYLYLLAMVAAAGVVGGGAETIRRANNTPNDDFWDSL